LLARELGDAVTENAVPQLKAFTSIAGSIPDRKELTDRFFEVNEQPTVISVEPDVVVVVQICNLFKSYLKKILILRR
jgi:hypothetical protein